MKRLILVSVLALLSLAGPGAAQMDPMAMQRCVWNCLARSSGASDPRYHMCVAQVCSNIHPPIQQAPVQAEPPNAQAWTSGVATDGITRFAGVLAADGSGRGLYYMCTFQGQSYLALFGADTPGGPLQLQIDGVGYGLNFHRNRGELTFDLPARSPFLETLPRGRNLRVVDGAGNIVIEATLSGAWAALSQTKRVCFN